MYGTVYHTTEESSNPMDHALRSISEATTEFVDWISGSQQDHVNDDPRVSEATLSKDASERTSVSTMGSSSSYSYGGSSPRLSEGSTTSSVVEDDQEEDIYHHDLSFTPEDVSSIVYGSQSGNTTDSTTFRQLQKALRNKGCVTNTYLQQNLHHYVYHLKQFQQEENIRRQRQQQRLKQQALAGRRHQAKYMAPPTAVVVAPHHYHHHQGPNQTSSIAA